MFPCRTPKVRKIQSSQTSPEARKHHLHTHLRNHGRYTKCPHPTPAIKIISSPHTTLESGRHHFRDQCRKTEETLSGSDSCSTKDGISEVIPETRKNVIFGDISRKGRYHLHILLRPCGTQYSRVQHRSTDDVLSARNSGYYLCV